MTREALEDFRRALLDRGRTLIRRRQEALAAETQLLAEREPDWEDQAAGESAAAVLDHLSEAEGRTLARIHASLERIARGTYGLCVICSEPIDEERLQAVPETDRCGGCTTTH
jgi:RNA polymerase-binding protein DksA